MPVDAEVAVRELRAALEGAGDPERALQEQRYLKSDLQHFGASVPAIRRVAVDFAGRRDLTRPELVALVERLWRERVHECRMLAVELPDLRAALLRAEDIALVERLLRESRTWALVDGLAASVAGGLVERFPELGAVLDRWAEDEDFWLRRSALLALLGPLRSGGGDFPRFARYADAMLDEGEFFIRKAIGWVLRETGRKRPELVSEWLLPRAARASGVTVREAVKHLPEREREEILRRYRGEG
jgi:3-methyladenine DNA glycosylase AlkD